MSLSASVFAQSFYHGTRADLAPGDLIVTGHRSNFTDAGPLSWVYFTATLDGSPFAGLPISLWYEQLASYAAASGSSAKPTRS